MSDNLFGERVRALRKKARLTQLDVAEKLNIHRTTYTKYETGCVSPDQQGLVQLAELFGVSTDYLVGHTDSPTPHHLAEDESGITKLSMQEQLLLQIFRQLSKPEQEQMIQQVQKSFRQRKAK